MFSGCVDAQFRSAGLLVSGNEAMIVRRIRNDKSSRYTTNYSSGKIAKRNCGYVRLPIHLRSDSCNAGTLRNSCGGKTYSFTNSKMILWSTFWTGVSIEGFNPPRLTTRP